MPRLLARSLMVLAVLLPAAAAAQPAVELSGVWRREDGGVVRLSQAGPRVEMVHVEVVPQVRKEFGFDPGDDHVVATLDGRALRGQMHVRLPLAWKTICPEQWDHWSGIELTLSDDGDTLQGRWERIHYTSQGCTVTRREWLPRAYTRVRQVAAREPGRLRAVTAGRPLGVYQFELILDASGSMRGTVGGRTKLSLAQEALRQVIDSLPDDVQAALRVYGHRIAPGQAGACQDSE
ncbi:MAG TPA: hypothetical protein VFX28_11860, partial [Methylomirabilota bacterium]|nr:hypothetical protein [Methylomirabilota bacterium]